MSDHEILTCGKCKFGCTANADFKAPLDCRAHPPHVAPIVGPQGQVGTYTSYPQVQRQTPACGEFVARLAS